MPSSRHRPWKLGKCALFWTLQVAGWLGFGGIMFVWGLEYWDPVDAAVEKLILVGTGFLLTLGFRQAYRRARARRLSYPLTALLIAALSCGGAALWMEVQDFLFGAYYTATAPDSPRVGWAGLGALLYNSFVLLAWSLLYFGINATRDLEQEQLRTAQAEARAKAARLQALQSQLEPHFLFNTLNAISTLVVEGKNAEAARMLARLADFLRLTLEMADTPEISLAEELEFVRRYLEIEQVRFGDRLRVSMEPVSDAGRALVPVLLLQPIVENAVKHGVVARESGGTIRIGIRVDGDRLHLSVTDDGPGLAEAGNRNGMGLANTAARLRELYGDNSAMQFQSSDQGCVVSITLPFRATREGGPLSSGEELP